MADARATGIVLDTHVWVWLANGAAEELSPDCAREVEKAAGQGAVGVSVISVWEVAMLEARGRIRLSRSVEEWTRAGLRARGVRLIGLTPEIAIESTRLPDRAPRDPADRILIASARIEGARLATRDRTILDYAAAGRLQVLDARP